VSTMSHYPEKVNVVIEKLKRKGAFNKWK